MKRKGSCEVRSYSQRADGTTDVAISGVDLGGPVTLAARRLHSDDGREFVAVKVKGHSAWAGLGADREYEPAQFHVFEVYADGSADLILSIPLKGKGGDR